MLYSQNDLLTLTYPREGGDRVVRLEKDKKDEWTKLPTSKKEHKMKRAVDRSIRIPLYI